MAIDKRLQIFDEQGNPVDYDIMATDVKFQDGKDLPTKLAEMEEEIGGGGYTPPVGGIPKSDLASDVQTSLGKADTAVQLGDLAIVAMSGSYNDLQDKPNIPAGVTVDSTITQNGTNPIQGAAIYSALADKVKFVEYVSKSAMDNDLSQPHGTIAIENNDGRIYFFDKTNELWCWLIDEYSIEYVAVPTTRTVNGKALSSNVTLNASDVGAMATSHPANAITSANITAWNDKQDAISDLATIRTGAAAGATALQPSDVSVETQGDGTVDVNVKDDTYTINLNHTHENMAKLVICEESDLPSTLDPATIYAITDSGETEIEKLIIRGMEFAGGGVPAGTPAITKPSGTSINLGENSGSGVSKAIEIKANSHITGDLTVGLAANSDLSFDTTNLPSGVTYNSGAGTLTIAQATAMQGVNITIVYSGSGEAEIDGGIVISGGGATPKSVAVVVVQLLAFWDGADLPSNNKWIDKINNLPINLFGTASHVTNGYQLNNLSDQDAAYALSDAANNTFLNQEIDKEFRVVVDCSIKFGATNRRALVLDFGAFGEAQSGLSANAFILQSGDLRTSTKKNGNTNGHIDTAQTDITFPVNTYVDVTIEMGARILQNGKQELYARAGNAINSITFDTPVAVSFAGTRENSGAFALGVGYFAGSNPTLNDYASDVFADVIYKSIKIYKG